MQAIKFLEAWFRTNWFALAKYGAVMLLTAGGLLLASVLRAEHDEELGVITEWNDAIRRLGIQPVFPPEEDIYVGDVLAVITNDRRKPKDPKAVKTVSNDVPLLGRAIKIHSEPMGEYLKAVYDTLPLFPPTTPRPTSESDPWRYQEKKEGVFLPTQNRGYLALAAFPGLTIRRDRAESGGLTGLGALFGVSRRNTDILALKIPLAETYGVPSLVASGILNRLCDTGGLLSNVCNDSAIRQHLSYVFGASVEDRAVDPVTNELGAYLVDVEMVFVSRVYLARSIEQRRAIDRDSSAQGELRYPAPPPNSAADSAALSDEDRKKAAEAADRALRQLLEKGVQGGAARVEYHSDNTVTLKQTFERPIVFGYRAVSKRFPPRLDGLNRPKREDTEP